MRSDGPTGTNIGRRDRCVTIFSSHHHHPTCHYLHHDEDDDEDKDDEGDDEDGDEDGVTVMKRPISMRVIPS